MTIAALLLASATVQPGIWEVSTRITLASTPSVSMPLGTEDRIIETSSAQLIDMIRLNFLNPDCKLSRYSDSDGKLDAAQACRSKKFGTTQWTLSGQYTLFHIKGRKVVTGKRNGLPEIFTEDFEARFLASGPAFPDASASSRDIEIGLDHFELMGTDERIKLHLLEDSRCPIGVLCEWPGQIRLQLEYQGARGFTRTGELTLRRGEPQPFDAALCAWTRRIELVSVEPPRRHREKLASDQYRFRFKLGQCGPMAPEHRQSSRTPQQD